jgi:sec-independent protein translocase protein TatB
MSGVGFSELVILFLIGLIVLGPERLPRVANQLGNWIGQARRMTRVMKRQLQDELDVEKMPDIKPPGASVPGGEQQAASQPANENDDTFSPAHGVDGVGSGVDDDIAPDISSVPDHGVKADEVLAAGDTLEQDDIPGEDKEDRS